MKVIKDQRLWLAIIVVAIVGVLIFNGSSEDNLEKDMPISVGNL
jgi:hypothetical protein